MVCMFLNLIDKQIGNKAAIASLYFMMKISLVFDECNILINDII